MTKVKLKDATRELAADAAKVREEAGQIRKTAEGLLQAAGDPVGGGRPGVSDWPGASILIPQVLAFLLNEASFPHMPPFSCLCVCVCVCLFAYVWALLSPEVLGLQEEC